MKRVLAMILSAMMMLSLCACGGNTNAKNSNAADQSGGDAAEKTYSVGIVQLMQHVALDQATQGFQDALTDKLGDKVTFDVQLASGEPTNCTTIVTKFVNDGVDLIMGNATPAVIAAKEATSTIPIVGTSVTDYVAAEAAIVASNDAPGGEVVK